MALTRTLKLPSIFGLGALLLIIGAFMLKGCYLSRTVDQATASDVNNQSFTFANGAVFHAALNNVSTTLCFTDNATTFTLSSSNRTVNGTNRFDSCVLTVTSIVSGTGDGPQVGEVITLDPCDFDSDRKTLTVSNRGLTTTSTVAAAGCSEGGGSVIPATADNVNNQSFTFSAAPAGGVFDSALNNVPTTLGFTNNATRFTLLSTGTVNATASGTSTVQSGTCTLNISTSDYTVGTRLQVNDTIRLSPCNFDSANQKLMVTNLGTATSDRSTPILSP